MNGITRIDYGRPAFVSAGAASLPGWNSCRPLFHPLRIDESIERDRPDENLQRRTFGRVGGVQVAGRLDHAPRDIWRVSCTMKIGKYRSVLYLAIARARGLYSRLKLRKLAWPHVAVIARALARFPNHRNSMNPASRVTPFHSPRLSLLPYFVIISPCEFPPSPSLSFTPRSIADFFHRYRNYYFASSFVCLETRDGVDEENSTL